MPNCKESVMANLKELCRFCGKINDLRKELMEENNRNILNFVEEVFRIKLSDEPKLPTKICLDCEEKMLSFQMFILNCTRVQDNLKKMLLEEVSVITDVKLEEMIKLDVNHDVPIINIKYEDVTVKNEDLSLDDIIADEDNSDMSFVDDSVLDSLPIETIKPKVKKVRLKTKRHKEENNQYKKKTEKHDKLDKPKVEDYIRFICVFCNKECSSWYTLNSHSKRLHKTMPIVQCVCGFSIKSKSVLYKHVSDHKNPNLLSCDKCPRVTKTISAMQKHQLRHLSKEERIFKCNDCPKIFNTKEAVKSHTKTHIPVDERKVFHCDMCDLKFTTRSSATSHRRVVHEKIKSYVCDLCGYSCGTSGELKQHRAIHSDDKPHVCTTCNKSFKTYSNLKTHMDTHDDTSYVCYVCSRVLNSRRTLKKHLLVHEEKCRHICSYCNKAFKRRQTLKVHMYTHTGDKPLSCRWCDERFAYASTLRSHRLRCHADKMSQPLPAPATGPSYIYKDIYHHPELDKDESLLSYHKNNIEMTTRLELK